MNSSPDRDLRHCQPVPLPMPRAPKSPTSATSAPSRRCSPTRTWMHCRRLAQGDCGGRHEDGGKCCGRNRLRRGLRGSVRVVALGAYLVLGASDAWHVETLARQGAHLGRGVKHRSGRSRQRCRRDRLCGRFGHVHVALDDVDADVPKPSRVHVADDRHGGRHGRSSRPRRRGSHDADDATNTAAPASMPVGVGPATLSALAVVALDGARRSLQALHRGGVVASPRVTHEHVDAVRLAEDSGVGGVGAHIGLEKAGVGAHPLAVEGDREVARGHHGGQHFTVGILALRVELLGHLHELHLRRVQHRVRELGDKLDEAMLEPTHHEGVEHLVGNGGARRKGRGAHMTVERVLGRRPPGRAVDETHVRR
mmetsp:Transcript_26283/g.77120  ORF Transcript_26283/g.77120 Transcript_26283/m.77120 type:complete len:367 (+) Transcript_26283:44-1144(+)